MLPIIPLIALFAIFGGGASLLWYHRLNDEQKEEADRLAAGYGRRLYGKALDELTQAQANHVVRLTTQHFAK